MKRFIFGLPILTMFILCQNDDGYQEIDQSLLDDTLGELILDTLGREGNSFFVLPDNDDFVSISQDPLNPIISAKVALGHTETQINDLTAFLSDALRDRDLTRYVPEVSNSGFCFPANDPQARIDLGCD